MKPIPEKYANKPNLWRVAQELATYEDPYRVLNALMALDGPLLKQEREDRP